MSPTIWREQSHMAKDMTRSQTHYATEHLRRTLREARTAASLSQFELGRKVGLTQNDISRIENGKQDPRTFTLLQLSRALGLELMLVPRAMVPAIRSILRGAGAGGERRPLYSLSGDDDGGR